MMGLFDKKFVHFMWDDELKGKKCFIADEIDDLRGIVENGAEFDLRIVLSSGNESAPFQPAKGVYAWRFAYYDPNYEVKKAYNKGKRIQVTPKGTDKWVDLHCKPTWDVNLEYRVKPDCPCEDGIDSKACAGCSQDELRKQTFRPFKNCDELVAFWSKNYQTGFRPAFTKPLIWVRLKVDKRERLIVAFGTDFVEIGNKSKAVTLQHLFEQYEFLDGSHCGMEVRNEFWRSCFCGSFRRFYFLYSSLFA